MTESALAFLRLFAWLLPGIFGLLAGRLWRGRKRVGLGLLIAGALVALLIKPVPLGWVLLGLGYLTGILTPRRL
jgi:hypothetical protein